MLPLQEKKSKTADRIIVETWNVGNTDTRKLNTVKDDMKQL